jgi:hypothetical protein
MMGGSAARIAQLELRNAELTALLAEAREAMATVLRLAPESAAVWADEGELSDQIYALRAKIDAVLNAGSKACD